VNIALQIDSLIKTYPNGVEALRGVSFGVKQGDFFALLGPNGAGKSTIIGIISSLIKKTSGQVKVFGIDTDDNFSLVKQYLGLVPQEFNFNGFEPIKEILMNQAGYYGVKKNLAKERADYYLNKVGLFEKRNDAPRLLSGGMKRRLMIARSLVHEPKLLILDEPTAGVDIEIRHTLWDFLTELNEQGLTIILTTHYLEEAEQLCRNIAILNHGILAENTSVKNLLKQLEKETFILDTQKSLDSSFAVDGYEVRLIDEHSFEVDVKKEQAVNGLFSALSAKGIQILSMRNKSNRLEKLFLDLVSSRENETSDAT